MAASNRQCPVHYSPVVHRQAAPPLLFCAVHYFCPLPALHAYSALCAPRTLFLSFRPPRHGQTWARLGLPIQNRFPCRVIELALGHDSSCMGGDAASDCPGGRQQDEMVPRNIFVIQRLGCDLSDTYRLQMRKLGS